jgi:hypothetical protein
VNRNAGFTAGIVALLALMARVVAPTAHGQSSQDLAENGKAKKGQGQPAAGTPQPYEGPWMATRHFFHPYDFPSSPLDFRKPEEILKCSADANCLQGLQQFFGLSKADGVECLLATVPDPFHTRLALLTDQTIEAIRKSAAATEWEFATQWLPWNDTVDPAEADPAKRAQERSDIRDQEKQPGVVVFRHADWRPGALLIFVVGETPTAGVNPDQFQIARAYMQALCDPATHPNKVRISGPTFSGSFYSLAGLILQDKAKQPGKTYQIRSGTTQSQGAAQNFVNLVESPLRRDVEFHSATENLWDQDRQFRDVLDQLRIPPDRAAVLSEGESTFGRAASRAWSHIEPRGTPSRGSPHQDIRVFRFPRDISHLRDSYRQAVQASKSDKGPTPNLDFTLKDAGVGEDSVPTYSQTQTPLSQNGVINEITRAIRRDDIRMVEVSATNVLDLLFLAGVLRRQCPDTRLLIQFADLLFVQAEQTQPLDGTLFLTSYPLFAESGLWQERREHRKDIAVYPDTLAEGTFNATVLLLAGEDPHRAPPPGDAWQSIPYPPAWLLTLDRRGFMPVKFWPNGPTKEWFQSTRGENPDLARVTMPRVWSVLSSLSALFAIAVAVWILSLRRDPNLSAGARFEAFEDENSWRGFYLFLFLLILIGIQIAIRAARPFNADWPMLVLLLPGCGLPAWIALQMGLRLCRLGQKHCLAMWLAAVAVAAAVWLWIFCCFGQQPQGQLFSFRAAELRFGSSPLWPIVAAAAALLLWCFVHVTRIYNAGYQQPKAIATGAETVLPGRLEAAYQSLSQSACSALGLFTPDLRLRFGIALALSVALSFLCRVDVHLGSIDGAPYDTLCIVLQLLVAGLLLLTCWHIRFLSKALHCFTTSLDLLPLARAFIQTSPSSGNRPIWVRRFNLQSLDIHTNSLLLLHDMRLQPKQLESHQLTVAQLEGWEKLYPQRICDALGTDPPKSRTALAKGHEDLWAFSGDIAARLWERVVKPAWESEPLVGKLSASPAAKAEEQETEEDEAAALITEWPLKITCDPKGLANLAETFLALHYSPFLLYGVRQIQNLLWFPSIGFVLLMLAMTSYSFQAPHLIGRLLMVLFVAISLILGSCMVELERDPILSRIAGTKPGQLSGTFYLKLARYGALPVLGLLAWQFPWISNFLFSWIEPALEAMG